MNALVASVFAQSDTRDRTLRMVGLAAVTGLVIGAYWPSLVSMADLWSISIYRHGSIIPMLSAYLIWRARDRFTDVPWHTSLTGIVLLGAGVWLWLIARATFVQAVEHAAVVLIVNAAVLAIAGVGAYRSICFPLAYLAFALPVGNSVVPLLMQLTADVSGFALEMIGIPVHRQGMLMFLPGGTFEVADVCSGFNYLYAGLALGTLVAYVMFRSNLRRLVYVVFVAAAFLMMNGLRACIVMAVASATDMRWLAGDDHVVFGWILFVVVLAALYFVAERLSDVRHAR